MNEIDLPKNENDSGILNNRKVVVGTAECQFMKLSAFRMIVSCFYRFLDNVGKNCSSDLQTMEHQSPKMYIERDMHPSHGKTERYYSRTCLIQRKVFYNNCIASAQNKLSRLYESSLTVSLLISSSQANIIRNKRSGSITRYTSVLNFIRLMKLNYDESISDKRGVFHKIYKLCLQLV